MYRTINLLVCVVACLLAGNASAASPVDLGALTKGCLDPAKPEALVQCRKLCDQGYKFYCDAIKGAGQPAEATPPTSPPVSATCNVPDDKLPKIEWFTPEDYAFKGSVSASKSKTKVEYLEYSCNKGNNLQSCKVLCKIGCKQYCNYCELGKAACARGDKYCNFYGQYKFLEQSLAPDKSTDEEGVGNAKGEELNIIHNCNPATKKRGVGIIPGGDENYIGFGYGRFGWCKGFCNELFMENYRPLRLAFEAGELGSKEEYDGIPTNLEMIWAGGHIPMCGPFFKKWNYPIIKGATPENPIRVGDMEYDMLSPVLQLQPGLNSYQVPPYPDGSMRYLCPGDATWIDSTGHDAHQQDLDSQCRGGDKNVCHMLCKRGQGYEQYCVLREEMSDRYYCERYGSPGYYQNVPSCRKLCESGKAEYQQYCGQKQ